MAISGGSAPASAGAAALGVAVPGELTPIAGFDLLHRLSPGVGRAAAAGGSSPVLSDGRPSGPAATACPDAARRALAAILGQTLDVVGGRRPTDVLRKLPLGDRVRQGLVTRMRSGGIKGAALRSLHPCARVCGTRVEFIGTWAVDGRVRALAGGMRDTGKGWTLTSLRLI